MDPNLFMTEGRIDFMCWPSKVAGSAGTHEPRRTRTVISTATPESSRENGKATSLVQRKRLGALVWLMSKSSTRAGAMFLVAGLVGCTAVVDGSEPHGQAGGRGAGGS